MLRNRERKARSEYDGTFLEIEPDRWRAQFVDHHERVEEYFRDRDDLLVMRVTEGDGYELLCPFLGVPISTETVPLEPQEHVDQPVTVPRPGRARPSQRTTVSAWWSSIWRRRSSEA